VAPLVRVAANLGAILATHIALEFVDGRGFGTADDVEGDGLVESQPRQRTSR
jgi:hypothetical protein